MSARPAEIGEVRCGPFISWNRWARDIPAQLLVMGTGAFGGMNRASRAFAHIGTCRFRVLDRVWAGIKFAEYGPPEPGGT